MIAYNSNEGSRHTDVGWFLWYAADSAHALGQLLSIDYSDATPDVAFTYDRLGHPLTVTDVLGTRTNVYDALNLLEEHHPDGTALVRSYDPYGRAADIALGPDYAVGYGYDEFGRFSTVAVSNGATFTYTYLPGTSLLADYTNTLGLSVAYAYEPLRDLKTLVSNTWATNPISTFAYDYDAVGRRTQRVDSGLTTNVFAYNTRSELINAVMGTNTYSYAYDPIGNRLWSSANAVTNSYTANSLNQYTAISANANPAYDADGNMTGDGTFAYAYNAGNRLVSVVSAVETNGAIRVLNAYDHRNRRIQKTVQRLHSTIASPLSPSVGMDEWETEETHTFVWDGNTIVLEKVEFADGTTRTFKDYWGLDKSGSKQGAGGVEGLLAVSVNGVFYTPCYDHNGNIIQYVSATGGIAAQYTYDPYGNVIGSCGNLADVFSFGFSTQYNDREIGVIGYQRRFYSPVLGRWLNRDPIDESGGENLYAFCDNNPVLYIDILSENFWGYFVDAAKTISGAFTITAGFTLGATVGWTGIGAAGAVGLIAIGVDQFASGVRNLVNRAQGYNVSNDTYVQVAYKYAAQKITGRTESGLEKTLDAMYFSAEIVSACATGTMSIRSSIAAVRSVGPARTAGHWVSVNGLIQYEFFMTASVSIVEAGTVVATEAVSTTLSGISFFSSRTNDVNVIDIEGNENDY